MEQEREVRDQEQKEVRDKGQWKKGESGEGQRWRREKQKKGWSERG